MADEEHYEYIANEYRKSLVKTADEMINNLDKTLIQLTSAGLGFSILFLTDIAGGPPYVYMSFLFWSWICWAIAILTVLGSFLTSHRAMNIQIGRVDNFLKTNGGVEEFYNKIFWSDISIGLTILGFLTFFMGVLLTGIFVFKTMEVL